MNAYRGDNCDDITDIDTIDNGIGEIPKDLFIGIAPFVESESYIEFHGDENDHYLVKFYQGKCEIITGQVIYPDSMQLSYDRLDALLNEVVSHEFAARKPVDAAESLLRIGFTGEELIKTFDVEEDNVREATRRIEEG